MTYPASTTISGPDDQVTLTLAGSNVAICESYDVHVGVFQQPASFSLRLGQGGNILRLIQATPPRTPFTLTVGGNAAFDGATDGYEAEGETGATEFMVEGRDLSAELHVGEFYQEESFTNLTYMDLAQTLLNRIGQGNATLLADNAATRRIRSGVGVSAGQPEPVPDDDVIADPTAVNTGAPPTIIRTKLNEKYMRFMRRHFDRAGIMFWAGAQSAFVLGQPNITQDPSYLFLRRRGLPSNQVNIIKARHRFSTVGRFAKCEVHSRNGGRAKGRARFSGTYIDQEMIDLGYTLPGSGFGVAATPLRYHAYRDVNCQSVAQCSAYAQRKAVEARRKSWVLTYELAGHTCPAMTGGGRATITPDTVAMVDDDELGLYGLYYVESCRYMRAEGGGTRTFVSLFRLQDMLLGSFGGV